MTNDQQRTGADRAEADAHEGTGARDRGTLRARVLVTLKPGVLDPQGQAIEGALRGLGHDGVSSVRQGKVFEIELDGSADAENRLRRMCEDLLANTVIERYRVEML